MTYRKFSRMSVVRRFGGIAHPQDAEVQRSRCHCCIPHHGRLGGCSEVVVRCTLLLEESGKCSGFTFSVSGTPWELDCPETMNTLLAHATRVAKDFRCIVGWLTENWGYVLLFRGVDVSLNRLGSFSLCFRSSSRIPRGSKLSREEGKERRSDLLLKRSC